MRVDATSYADATDRIVAWAENGNARAVGIANVNNVMEGHDDETFLTVMNACDLVTPDGKPLAWGLRLLGVGNATQVRGPELTPRLLARAAERSVPVGFYGGSPDVLAALRSAVATRWPSLEVVYAESPPFRPLTDDEDREVVEAISRSTARIVFVGLGCPKQERWIVEHRDRLDAVLIGVGAAFDFLAGSKREAPAALQRIGLEWLYRLASEPKRLWRRYLRHNPRFVVLFGAQVVRLTRARTGKERISAQRRQGNRS
jgi:N-acetylglucosaminyldiphosphoundecaprenol N-acetyl-beta-D-mannosaminyltransferase